MAAVMQGTAVLTQRWASHLQTFKRAYDSAFNAPLHDFPFRLQPGAALVW